jgi:hypothetical protein
MGAILSGSICLHVHGKQHHSLWMVKLERCLQRGVSTAFFYTLLNCLFGIQIGVHAWTLYAWQSSLVFNSSSNVLEPTCFECTTDLSLFPLSVFFWDLEYQLGNGTETISNWFGGDFGADPAEGSKGQYYCHNSASGPRLVFNSESNL